MSTTFGVVLAVDEQPQAKAAAEAAFAELDRQERLLSRFDQGSEIALINRLKPGESLRVGIDTVRCLWLAKLALRETEGAFDVTAGAPIGQTGLGRLELWEISETLGGLQRERLLNPDEHIDWTQADAPRFFQVRVHEAKMQTATSAQEAMGLRIDLGGIGKGYALDRAAEVLAAWEVKAALLHGGTSTALVFGEPPITEGWPLGVGGPWGDEAGMNQLMLMSGSLSGSGLEVKGAHIIDPRTNANAVTAGDSATAGGSTTGRSLAAWVLLSAGTIPNSTSSKECVAQPPSAVQLEQPSSSNKHSRGRLCHTRPSPNPESEFEKGSSSPAENVSTANEATGSSTTALANAAALTDAYSTAFMVMSTEEVAKFCARRPEVSALKIAELDGEVVAHRFGPWPGVKATSPKA